MDTHLETKTRQEKASLTVNSRRKAGHYEILGETYAKFEFFENDWNPYSRFLDVDKFDLILRRKNPSGETLYLEVQVKFGKLYEVGSRWEQELFDVTSFRFFKEDEFAGQIDQKDFFIAYILARDIGYKGEISSYFPSETSQKKLSAAPSVAKANEKFIFRD